MDKKKRYRAGAYVDNKWYSIEFLAEDITSAKIIAKKDLANKADVSESKIDCFTCFHVSKGIR